MLSSVRLSALIVASVLSLVACSASSTSPAKASSPDTRPTDASSPAASTPSTATSAADTSGGAAGNCSKAKDAVEAMSSVIPQGSKVTKVTLTADCKTLSVATSLQAADKAVALAICSQIDSPAYAGGAEAVAITTADGSVTLAKGAKGAACA